MILIILNILILVFVEYGWWVFFCFTLWTLLFLFIINIIYSSAKRKIGDFAYIILLSVSSIFPIFLIVVVRGNIIPSLIWEIVFCGLFYFLFSSILSDYTSSKKKNKESRWHRWKSSRKIKLLNCLLIFYLLCASLVLFPYVFEPVVQWKSDINKDEIQKVVNEIIADCDTDEEKTKEILNWFERYRGNIFNIWGYPKIETIFGPRQILFVFGDGHEYSGLFFNFCVRTHYRDYPSWVFSSRSGACEEYTILFSEMATAAGLTVKTINCREADHLWSEVLIDDNWIIINPSLLVHNRLNEREFFSGYNIPKENFLYNFIGKDDKISYIFAEYSNGTKEIVTSDYIDNVFNITILVLDENDKPVPNVAVKVLSNNREPGQDIELNFITDDNGKYELPLGEGSLTFQVNTDGFIFLSGEKTVTVDKNISNEVKIIVEENWINPIIVVLTIIVLIVIFTILTFRRKKSSKHQKANTEIWKQDDSFVKFKK